MADTVDMKEDGEVRIFDVKTRKLRLKWRINFQIDSDGVQDEIYTKVMRPQESTTTINQMTQQRYNSESSESSDSDGETPKKKFLKRLEK